MFRSRWCRFASLTLLAILAAASPVRGDDRRCSARPKITFAVNVHDFVNLGDSARTILSLIEIFQKYDVKGDFYLTGPICQFYLDEHPEVIAALRESRMTVSYHVRPPHPLYGGFDGALRGLSDEELRLALIDYETHALDLETGQTIPGTRGGYALLRDTFGRPPVTVSPQNGDERIRAAAIDLWRAMGAKVCVDYHETGTDPEDPFEYEGGLLVRPSDFSVTRWTVEGSDREPFWWAMLGTPLEEEYDPVLYLDENLESWSNRRAPFITALIHDDNFYRQGATPFVDIYYVDGDKSRPRSPPYDLSTPDPSNPRSSESQALVLAEYERLVAHAAGVCQVVTSAEIAAMAARR